MLKHIVLVNLTADADDAYLAEVGAKIDALPEVIDQVVGVAYGSDIGLTSGSSDFAIIVDLDDVESYAAYAAHEAHVELAELIKKGVASRTVIDLKC
ncbi:hypothetical protein ABH922_005024 [Rhodococcus sp. 27YEA15]|uniref:Dabb family protein n=1 Tax=Rhodococcus sp. 27YEA15 TaxID=3156259 RepID=UPI003C7EC99A